MTLRNVLTGFATLVALTAALDARPVSAARPAAARALQRTDTIVKQAGRPRHANGGTLVPELSIGVVDGAQEYMFGSVRDVLETREGSLLVVDGQAFAVRQYDAKGVYVRTIGRKGQGPGEYTRPGLLAELRDGRILLVDGGGVRVNVYSPTGEPIDTWSLALAGSNIASSRILVDTTGTVVVPLYAFGGGIAEGSRLLRFGPDGRIVDTIHAPVFAYTPPTATSRTARGNVVASIPFFPVTEWHWSPLGYMVTGVANRYAFELRLPRPRPTSNAAIPAMRYRGPTAAWRPGDPVVSIRHSVPPVPINEEQRSVERTGVERIIHQLDPTWRYSGPEIPRIKPPYKDLRVGDDGTIWVHLAMPGERYMPDPPPSGSPMAGSPVLPRWREPAVYDVFEPDGRYLGRVTRDDNVRPIRMTRSQVWAEVTDEDDVSVVKRFRIDWR